METSIFGNLAPLRQKPIPEQAPARARMKGCRQRPIDAATRYGNEKLVALEVFGIAGENYYHSLCNPPYWRRIDGSIPDLLLRRTVAEKLARINERLGEAGLELFVFDAFRPRAVQAYFHDVWMPAELKKRDASLEGAALIAKVERYWSAPTSNPLSPAPHETGAALDVSLRRKGGDFLWMGSLFDDVTEIAHRDRFEHPSTEFSFSNEEARANRRLLHWVMAEEGFAGHPEEWWHHSWGDQIWAAVMEETAFYGLAARDGIRE